MGDIKYYKDSKGNNMAILIPSDYTYDGIKFFTSDKEFQQIAYMGHTNDHIIEAHYHNDIPRIINKTCETIIMRKGILEVNLYENNKLIYSFEIKSGDILSLISGGHGFKTKGNTDFIEVKQGPYMGEKDKTRFGK